MGLGNKDDLDQLDSPLKRLEKSYKNKKRLVALGICLLLTAIIVPIAVTANNNNLAEEERKNKIIAAENARAESAAFAADLPKWKKAINQCHAKFARIDKQGRTVDFLSVPNNPGSWGTDQTKCVYFMLTGSIEVSPIDSSGGVASSIYWEQGWDEKGISITQKENFPLAKEYFMALGTCNAWIPESEYEFSEDTYIDYWKEKNSYDFDAMYEVRTINIFNRGFNSKKYQELRCIGKEILGTELLSQVLANANKNPIKRTFAGMTFTIDYTRDENGEYLIIDRTLVDGVQRFD